MRFDFIYLLIYLFFRCSFRSSLFAWLMKAFCLISLGKKKNPGLNFVLLLLKYTVI